MSVYTKGDSGCHYFQGELEQLTVADEASGGVSEQCSPNRMPFQGEDNNSDIHIEEDKTTHKKKGMYQIKKSFG